MLTVVALAAVAVSARFSDGPISVFPGGPLVSGVPTKYGTVEWDRVDPIRELELQLENPPRSRITRFLVYEGAPYIPCAFCTNRLLKRWPRELQQDDRVILRVDGCSSRAGPGTYPMTRPNTWQRGVLTRSSSPRVREH